MDLLIRPDESSSQISDKIKDVLFAKSAERIEAIRPQVAASVFDDMTSSDEQEFEVDSSLVCGSSVKPEQSLYG